MPNPIHPADCTVCKTFINVDYSANLSECDCFLWERHDIAADQDDMRATHCELAQEQADERAVEAAQ